MARCNGCTTYEIPGERRQELLDLLRKGDPAVVFIENQDTGMFLEEQADLAGYRLALRNILNAALAPAATAELVSSVVAELS